MLPAHRSKAAVEVDNLKNGENGKNDDLVDSIRLEMWECRSWVPLVAMSTP